MAKFGAGDTAHFRFVVKELFEIVDEAARAANELVMKIKEEKDGITVGKMLNMQMTMNKLSQVSDSVTNVLVSMHQSITNMVRGIKGQ